MKYLSALPFAALASAFVIPSEQVLSEVEIEDHHEHAWYDSALSKAEGIFSSVEESVEEAREKAEHSWTSFSESSRNALDDALAYASEAAEGAEDKLSEKKEQLESWYDTASDDVYNALEHGGGHHGGHGKHPHKPNMTVYQLIAESKYTTRLAKLINEYPDLVEALNGTKANYTVFAPTDKAFAKIPDHAPKPSKEQLKKILEYHVSPDFYPAGRVLASHTAPTLLQSEHLASEPEAQRIAFKITLRGLTVNFYARVVAINIFGTNGVIHGVDSIIIPPPKVVKIVDLFPGEFSTLELGLTKTGLLEEVNSTDHAGGTLFAPSNFAFQKLGPKINAFLFSQYGLKYLRALLEYHFAAGTLYSDAYYKVDPSKDLVSSEDDKLPGKGVFHLDMPTMLKDRSLSVDVARFARFIEIKINGFSRVSVQDGVAQDGVVHVVSNVLIPPKNIGGPGSQDVDLWQGEELTVEEFKERLEPFVPKSDL